MTVSVVGCGQAEPAGEPVDPATYESGRALYGEFCSSCHGSEGGGGVGPAISNGRAAERVGGVPDIRSVIALGGDRMPGLEARLTPEQIADIAQYVHDRL